MSIDLGDSYRRARLRICELVDDEVGTSRSRLGRRTAAEVTAYDWSGDPAPYLATWFIFGHAARSLGE